MTAWFGRLRTALFGYPLVVPPDVIAYQARRAGCPEAAMRAAFRRYPPDTQRALVIMTALDKAGLL